MADTQRPFDVLIGGIGGTGVVTEGALLGTAAHLEGKGCSTLDVTGLAQKNGPVTSPVRVADDPEALFASRIAEGRADLVLGCDIVVSSGSDTLSKMSKDRTTAVVNTHVAPTSAFASHPDLDFSPLGKQAAISKAAEEPHFVDATRLATALLGDALAANLFLLGYALQRGRLPVGLPALHRAIELNARSVEMNKRALAFSSEARAFGLPSPKCILMLGVQGCGKSLCAKAVSNQWQLPLRCDALGVDWTTDLSDARRAVGDRVALQGNLDPSVLYAPPEQIRAQVARVLASFGRGHGHVFNLGHGIHPDVSPENALAMVEAVHALSPQYHV